jgi:hypothetical protein
MQAGVEVSRGLLSGGLDRVRELGGFPRRALRPRSELPAVFGQGGRQRVERQAWRSRALQCRFECRQLAFRVRPAERAPSAVGTWLHARLLVRCEKDQGSAPIKGGMDVFIGVFAGERPLRPRVELVRGGTLVPRGRSSRSPRARPRGRRHAGGESHSWLDRGDRAGLRGSARSRGGCEVEMQTGWKGERCKQPRASGRSCVDPLTSDPSRRSWQGLGCGG